MSLEAYLYLFIYLPVIIGAANWSYKGDKGPNKWHLVNEACSGQQQSPINIIKTETTFNPELNEFALWHDPPKPGSKFRIINNGHAVQVNIEGPFKVANGGLPSEFTSKQFHFHWGHANHHGSEHLINGYSFPLELHVVNFDSDKYMDISEAVVQPMGLAVLGVMYQLSSEDNPALEPIIRALEFVRKPEDKNAVEIDATAIRSFLPEDTTKYYRYNGSLTTPGCFESVIWTVFEEAQTISHRQMREFRKVLQTKKHGHKKRRRRRSEEIVEEVLGELGINDDEKAKMELQIELEAQEAMKNAEKPFLGEPPEKIHLYEGSDDPQVTQGTPHDDTHDGENAAYSVAGHDHSNDDRDVLVDNFRPVQPLNGRNVLRSFEFEIYQSKNRPMDVRKGSSSSYSDDENNAMSIAPSFVIFLCSCLLYVL